MRNTLKTLVLACALAMPFHSVRAADAPASAEIAAFPDDLKYEKLGSDGQIACRAHVDDMQNLFDFFHTAGFTYLNEKFGDGDDFLGSDQIFARFEEGRFVYFITNLQPIDRKFRNRLVKLGDNYVLHGSTAHGMPYGLMFQNFSAREATAIAASIEEWRVSVPQVAEARADRGWLISSANAGTKVCPVEKGSVPGEVRDAKTIKPVKLDSSKEVKKVMEPDVEELLNDGFLSRAWRCAGNMLRGAGHVLAAPFVFIGHVVRTGYRVVTNPKDVWANTKATFGNVNESIQSMVNEGVVGYTKTRVQNKIQDFKDLPAGEKTKKVCEIVGKALAIAATIYFYPRIPFDKLGGKIESIVGHGPPKPGMLNFRSTGDATAMGQRLAGRLGPHDFMEMHKLFPDAPWPPNMPLPGAVHGLSHIPPAVPMLHGGHP